MRLTRSQIISDIQGQESLIGYYDEPIMSSFHVYRISLTESLYDLSDVAANKQARLFAEMALWCFDNCTRGKWYLSWNLDAVYFTEETDIMAFKLRWL